MMRPARAKKKKKEESVWSKIKVAAHANDQGGPAAVKMEINVDDEAKERSRRDNNTCSNAHGIHTPVPLC